MNPDDDDYRAAKRRADTARVAFFDALDAFKDRISADRLKTDAKMTVYKGMKAGSAGAASAVRSHPGVVVGIVTIVIAYVCRRPITAAVRKAYRKTANAVGSYRSRRNNHGE